MAYQVKKEILDKHPILVTTIDNKAVNLTGKTIKKVTPATTKTVAKESVIDGATQKELQIAFESGHPFIEFIEAVLKVEKK